MAISWGSYVNNSSGNGMRVGYEFSQSPASVGTGTTSVSVTVKVYVETKASVVDSTNTLTIGGDFSWSDSVNINHGSGGDVTLVRTMSRTVSTSYTASRVTSVSVSLTGINAIPGTASESGSHTTSSRPYAAPKAPSSVASVRSGTSVRTLWTRNPTTGQPYDNVRVRRSVNGGSYADRSTLSGGSTSYNDTGLTPNSSYRYAVRSENSAGSSAWVYGGTVTIPPNAPAAPSNAKVARSSDARQIVSWTKAGASSTAPVSQYEVQRRDVYSGTWATIATVSSSVSSYTDSSTRGNKQYQYRVRSKNGSGTSGWSTTGYVSTTPNAPTSPKAVKQGSDIKLSWTNVSGTRITAIEIWLTADGADQSPVHVRISGSPTSWTHTSPDPSKTWAYRLKTQSGADANDASSLLYSGFSSRSNTVQLIAPPAAPSGLVPSAVAVDALEDQRFSWIHNPVDTTDQLAYELQYRVDSAVWIGTGKTVSGSSFRDFPVGTFENGTNIEWRVRTWGDHVDSSPWSPLAIVVTSSRPAVTILYPDGEDGIPDHFSTKLTATWEYFDPEDTMQTSVRLRVEDENGSAVWSQTLQTSATSYDIPYTFADSSTYTLVVSVRDAAGLWSYEASQAFLVTYAKPPAPLIEAVWNLDLGGVVVSIEHPEPVGNETAAVSADLQHSANGSEWKTIAAGLDPITSTVDFIPVLDTMNYYRLISYSAMPSSMESAPISVLVESKGWVFINGGPGFTQVARIRDNASVSYEVSRAKARHHFAGRRFPMETTGESRTEMISLSARVGGGSSTVEELEAIADLPAPLCFRDPSRRVFVGVNALSSTFQKKTKEISMSFEKVDYIE